MWLQPEHLLAGRGVPAELGQVVRIDEKLVPEISLRRPDGVDPVPQGSGPIFVFPEFLRFFCGYSVLAELGRMVGVGQP